MRILPLIFTMFVLLLSVAVYKFNSAQQINSNIISATIFPIYDMTRVIAGSNFEVNLLLPPGSSPHTFEITPTTSQKIENSNIIFSVGILDNWAVSNSAGSKVIDLSESVVLLDNRLTDDHDETDPHYWMDAENAILIAEKIASVLQQTDPENSAYYASNLQLYRAELEALDNEIAGTINQLPKKNIATFHNSMAYYAAAYGLKVNAVFEEFPGREPGPQYLADFTQVLAAGQVDAVYGEPQLPMSRLLPIAEEHGITTGVIDPIGGSEGRQSYLEIMRYNTEVFKSTLQ